MLRVVVVGLLLVSALRLTSAVAWSAEPAPASPDTLRAAVGKALPLLGKAAAGHIEHRTCFACHNQALPLLAFRTALEHGIPVAAEEMAEQTEFIASFLERNEENFRQGRGTGGQVDSAGYALLALELGGWQSDMATEAVAEYLLRRDREHDHWRAVSKRPPSEASDFTTTYLALRGLRRWAVEGQEERVAQRTEAARGWLLRTPARDTEDRVFRLLALPLAGADDADVRRAAAELLATQRADGGWAQTETMTSDAYATGSALVALHQAGSLLVTHPAYQRGLAFLLKTQQEDGSWLVHSRSRPFQTYYESGFPHGKDQFISAAASGWAAAALALALPPGAPADAARLATRSRETR